VLIDTDVMSALLRHDSVATARLAEYVALFGHVTWSVVTSYEVLRGLRWKRAMGREIRFVRLFDEHEVLPITSEIADVAASLHADARTRGVTVGDADTLIAATALVHHLGVATGNVKHFVHFPQLSLENWMAS
jgi:tRNA(fMet)-specific endonuclease VapC